MKYLNQPLLSVNKIPRQRDARKGYDKLSQDDKLLRRVFEREFEFQLDFFDELMAFNYELLIIVYRNVDVWKELKQRRFVHAALSSSFNHLLFARKAISLGYPSESQLVFRSAMEWFARAALFHEDESAIDEFIEKGELKDSRVRDRLGEIFDLKQPGVGQNAAKFLRKRYRKFSDFGHATFKSLVNRTFPKPMEAKNKTQRRRISHDLGVGFLFGGFTTTRTAYEALIEMLSLGEMVMQTAVAQIPNDKQDIEQKFENLRTRVSQSAREMQYEIDHMVDE